MGLRDYQVSAIERLRKAISCGARRPIIVSPTGSGKTHVLAEIVRRTVANGKRVLWLSHRAELIDQAAETLIAYGLVVGSMCAGSQTPPNPFAPVQVASVQTLLARNERPRADVVIVDEAHHFALAAEAFSAVLSVYPDAIIIGATATPERGDGCGLRGSFDGIVVVSTISELTALGYLVPCEVLRPEKPLGPSQIARNPVDAYVEHAAGRRTIVFCKSVPLAEEYASEFNMRGITARCITAETPWAERRLYLEAFKRGTIQVLTNVYVLTEGFDVPELSCVVIARGCGSAGMFLQMIGRALRPAEGKTNAVLLDLRGVSHEHGRPEDERTFSLDGRGIRLRDPNSYCPVCGAPRTPPEPCASCGYTAGGEEGTKPDKVTGDSLKPWMRLRVTDSDDKRAERLGRWMADGAARGFKPGWAKQKFHAVYGQWPTAGLLEAAREQTMGVKEEVA